MSVISFLSTSLCKECVAFDAKRVTARGFERKKLLNQIAEYIFMHMKQDQRGSLAPDPICFPWRETAAHRTSLPNNGGVTWNSPSADAMRRMDDTLTTEWFVDVSAPVSLRDMYAAAPAHRNPSVLGVMGALLMQAPGAADITPLHFEDIFTQQSCPDSKFPAVDHMPACLQALTHTVRAQYEAVVLDGTVFTNPRDIPFKYRAITRASLPTMNVRAPVSGKTTTLYTVLSLLQRVATDTGTTYGKYSYAVAVYSIYMAAVSIAKRWTAQGFRDELSSEEVLSVPDSVYKTVLELVAISTGVLVTELQSRIFAATSEH